MARFFRKFYRRYRRKYSRSRKYYAKPIKATKAFTLSLRQSAGVNFSFEPNANVSNVMMLTAYGTANADLAALANPMFSKFSQIFGEFKINSLRVEIVPSISQYTGAIYSVIDRKCLTAETKPTNASVTQSMTAVSKAFNSGSTARTVRLAKAYGIHEKSTYIDTTNPTGVVSYGTAFLPAVYAAAFINVTPQSATTIPCNVTVIASVTFRNPLY